MMLTSLDGQFRSSHDKPAWLRPTRGPFPTSEIQKRLREIETKIAAATPIEWASLRGYPQEKLLGRGRVVGDIISPALEEWDAER